MNRVFSQGGNIPVTLVVTDDDGVTDEITRTITIEINSDPIAQFSFSPATEISTNTNVIFTSNSTDDDGHIIAYLWAFGDEYTSSVQTPSHKYTSAGTYDVTLTVTDNEGATSSITRTLAVGGVTDPVDAEFSWKVDTPGRVEFTDESTGAVATWEWDFGDGNTSNEQNPRHTYEDTNRKYSVTLTVLSSGGMTDTVVKSNVDPGKGSESGLAINLVYPNPASARAQFELSGTEEQTNLTLRIFDLAGRIVLRAELDSGTTNYDWDLRNNAGEKVAHGLYLCLLSSQNETAEVFRLLVAQ